MKQIITAVLTACVVFIATMLYFGSKLREIRKNNTDSGANCFILGTDTIEMKQGSIDFSKFHRPTHGHYDTLTNTLFITLYEKQ